MSIDTSANTFTSATRTAKVKRDGSFVEQKSTSSSDATLADMMANANLEDQIQHPTRDSDVVKRKTLFDVTKFTRGKAKGGVGPFPWLAYFLSVCSPGSGSLPEIYVWVINSENSGSIYHMNQQSKNLEFLADGTQSFKIGDIDYLPDILNRKLYIPTLKPARVIMRTLDDAQTEHDRIWAEEFDRYLNPASTPILMGGPPHVSDSVDSGESTSHNPYTWPAQPASVPHRSPLAGCSQAPRSSSQMQRLATTANTVALPPNAVELSVPPNVTTSQELDVHVTNFKAGYKSRGDKSLKVVCGGCGAIQNDLRPSSLVRHLATHLDIKDHTCDKCSGAFVTVQQLERHRKTHKSHVYWFSAKMARRNE